MSESPGIPISMAYDSAANRTIVATAAGWCAPSATIYSLDVAEPDDRQWAVSCMGNRTAPRSEPRIMECETLDEARRTCMTVHDDTIVYRVPGTTWLTYEETP